LLAHPLQIAAFVPHAALLVAPFATHAVALLQQPAQPVVAPHTQVAAVPPLLLQSRPAPQIASVPPPALVPQVQAPVVVSQTLLSLPWLPEEKVQLSHFKPVLPHAAVACVVTQVVPAVSGVSLQHPFKAVHLVVSQAQKAALPLPVQTSAWPDAQTLPVPHWHTPALQVLPWLPDVQSWHAAPIFPH
jgi:hypothetical protein